MKLDHNIDGNKGRGKYALLLLRKLDGLASCHPDGTPNLSITNDVHNAIRTLENAGMIDWGAAKTQSEFFVIRLKDQHACKALAAYAEDAWKTGDKEWGDEVSLLCDRAGLNNPNCKLPD